MQLRGALNESYDEMSKRRVMIKVTIRNHGLEGLLFIQRLILDQPLHKMIDKVLLLKIQIFILFSKGKRYGF